MELIEREPDYRMVAAKVVRHELGAFTFADGLEGEVDLHGHLWGPGEDRRVVGRGELGVTAR